MEEKFGIENLKKVLAFGIKVGTDISADLEDGKISLQEGLGLIPDLMGLPDLIANKQAIIDEAKDLSTDEIKELATYAEGAINEESVVATIEDALNLIISAKNLIVRFTKKAA